MADLEVPAFVASVFLALKSWAIWYGELFSVNRLRTPLEQRAVLFAAPAVSFGLILACLRKFAATDVRDDPFYIAFYLLVGAAWVGGGTLLFPLLGISARDDVLERGNGASAWAIVGALSGISCSFAGANIGEGPGAGAVLLSALLSSGLFFALWFAVDSLTPLSEEITVDRTDGAGVRLGGLLISLGLLSGWSVAGNWVSAQATIADLLRFCWPAVGLAAFAISLESALKRASARLLARTMASAAICAFYVAFGLCWVAMKGVRQ